MKIDEKLYFDARSRLIVKETMQEHYTKVVAENRKARYNYFIEDTYEAGMVLLGTEVKSLRLGRANLKDSYARITKGEVFVHQMHIGAYPFAHYGNHDPLRIRKLLLHKREIKKLYGKINERGYSLIPLKLYFQNGKAKLTLALAKGKRKHDKREAIRRRDQERDLERSKKEYK
jgi:SsrA-binding protein